MNPDLLQSLTAAKGLPMPIEEGMQIDTLSELFRNEKRLRELVRKLEARGEKEAAAQLLASPIIPETATGKSTKTSKPLEYTHAECAMACKGLDQRYFDAHRYTYALDDSCFFRLSITLWEWALERRERERWPVTIVTQSGTKEKFLRDLVEMWLIEVRQPWRFVRRANQPDLRRVIMDVSEPVWRRRLSPIYEAIAEEFICWLSIARAHMAPWLRDDVA